MSQFAIGKLAYGFCERCGLRYDLREFKAELVKGNSKNNRVCPDCWDPDHPQNFIGTYRIEDPQGLKRPVPELGTDSINAFVPLSVKPRIGPVSVGIGNAIGSIWSPLNASINPISGLYGDPRQAFMVTDNTAGTQHGVSASSSLNLGANITVACTVSPTGFAGNDQFGIRIDGNGGANFFAWIWNQSGTSVGQGSSAGTYTILSTSQTDMGSNWWRFLVTFTIAGPNPLLIQCLGRKSAIGSLFYVGDNTPIFSFLMEPEITNP